MANLYIDIRHSKGAKPLEKDKKHVLIMLGRCEKPRREADFLFQR